MEYIVAAVVIYLIIQALSPDRKDRKRWPFYMRMEDNCKKCGAHKAYQSMHKMRMRARKDEAYARKLDAMDAQFCREHTAAQPQRDMADMQRKMDAMQRQMEDLERRARY